MAVKFTADNIAADTIKNITIFAVCHVLRSFIILLMGKLIIC